MQPLRVTVVALAAMIAVAGSRGPTLADDASTTTTIQPAPPPQQTTKILGELPADLPGRWLALGQVALASGNRRSVPVLWEITRADGNLVLTVEFATLPPAMQKAVDDSNAAEKGWTPTPADLAALADGWDTLPRGQPGVATVETELIGHDAYDEEIKKDDAVKDTLWMVRTSQSFLPSAAPMIKQVSVYGASRAVGNGWEGTFAHLMLAAAPFPIPISLKGDFHLYRLGGSGGPAKGFLARLFDAFSGCGRR